MNTRTVLSIDPFGDSLLAKIVRSPFPASVHDGLAQVNLSPENLPHLNEPSAVLSRGKMVRDALRQHKGICNVLDGMSTAALHEIRPLFVVLGLSQAELINWEMLCDKNEEFVALDHRWPIARIVEPIRAPSQLPCELEDTVRLMLIISALGVGNQKREWELLLDAVLDARKKGLRVEIKVLVGLTTLFDSITDQIAKGLKGVEVAPLENSSAKLTQAISQWAPHIVHFFCHGYSGPNGQWLELATANDHLQWSEPAADIKGGSVIVNAKDLVTLSVSLKNTWLMVLNCCSSGNASNGLQSMANQIVAAGVPAVVAMMEPVSVADAYEFTQAFYPGALSSITNVQTGLTTQSSTTLEWTTVLYQARIALAGCDGRNTHDSPQWSLPMLYVRGIEAQLFVRPVAKEHRVPLETTAQWLRTAGQQLSPDKRQEILANVLGHIPSQLWPDVEGEFLHAGQ